MATRWGGMGRNSSYIIYSDRRPVGRCAHAISFLRWRQVQEAFATEREAGGTGVAPRPPRGRAHRRLLGVPGRALRGEPAARPAAVGAGRHPALGADRPGPL